jgi:hypothetical protein
MMVGPGVVRFEHSLLAGSGKGSRIIASPVSSTTSTCHIR